MITVYMRSTSVGLHPTIIYIPNGMITFSIIGSIDKVSENSENYLLAFLRDAFKCLVLSKYSVTYHMVTDTLYILTFERVQP